jgi:cobalt-zinc-cadmium efflux system protein
MDTRIRQHSHSSACRSTRNLRTAFILNLLFTIIEIVGGLLTNSIAILSDAVHDFGDSAMLMVSWRLEKLSERGRTDRLTFGYKRYSLLAALVSAVVLMFGSVYILSRAVPRLFSPEHVEPRGMLAIAVLGVIINSIAVLRLKESTCRKSKDRCLRSTWWRMSTIYICGRSTAGTLSSPPM